MDGVDLSAKLTKLRRELAEIRYQIAQYRSKRHHSHLEEEEHFQREVRIRETREELERMMPTKAS